jgi:hypothetical protein
MRVATPVGQCYSWDSQFRTPGIRNQRMHVTHSQSLTVSPTHNIEGTLIATWANYLIYYPLDATGSASQCQGWWLQASFHWNSAPNMHIEMFGARLSLILSTSGHVILKYWQENF